MTSPKPANTSKPKEHARKNPPRGICIGQPFNPFKVFNGIFIPDPVVRYQGLSTGAKLIFGRLARFAGENGECYPSIPTLAAEIGLGPTQARNYVNELRSQGFIAIELRPGTSAAFTFLWHEAFNGEIGDKRKTPPLRKTGPPPLRKTGPPPLRKTGGKENHHQENQKKKTREHLGEPAVRGDKRSGTYPEESTRSLSLNPDDEKPKKPAATRPAFGDPLREFKARISERHPGSDPQYVLKCLRSELSEKNLSLRDFIDFDARCTTNPHVVKNPAGYYRDLARRLNAELEAAAFEERRKLNDQINALLAVPETDKTKGPTCPICHGPEGKGIMLSADSTGIEPCSCATAEFASEFREKESARRKKLIEVAAKRERPSEGSKYTSSEKSAA